MSKNARQHGGAVGGGRSPSRMHLDYLLNHDTEHDKSAWVQNGRAHTPKSVMFAGLGDRNASSGMGAASNGHGGGSHQHNYQHHHHDGHATNKNMKPEVAGMLALRKGKSVAAPTAASGGGGHGGGAGISGDGVAADPLKERKFDCEQCGSTFGMKSNLKRHIMTVHEDRRGWRCDICGAAFGLKQNLGTHVRVKHEKKRPFLCDLCGVSFGYKQVLQNHRRNIHGVQ